MHSEIIGIGLAVLDHLMIVPDFPSQEGVIPSSQYEVQGGGMVATALVTAQRLGASTELWGRLGDDEIGHTVLKELRGFNVNTSQVHLVGNGKTGVCFVLVRASDGQRTFVVHPQKNLYVDLNLLNLERIRKARALLVDVTWIEAAQKAAHFAKSHGIPVVADVHEPSQPALELLNMADYAIVPRQMAEFLGGKGDYTRALHALKSKGVKVPIITLGDEGCTYLYKDKIFKLPAYRVKAVDTTGAGDSFHGAFCFGVSRGFGVPESIGLASAVAALACTKLGGRAGVPTYEETLQFMREQAASA
ncbi:MAG: PfkB family carbohydrate kinase [Terriglobia bacterium]